MYQNKHHMSLITHVILSHRMKEILNQVRSGRLLHAKEMVNQTIANLMHTNVRFLAFDGQEISWIIDELYRDFGGYRDA
jgi:hypothetical protein